MAHQQKESITRMLFNERTGNIEVMHRFYIHDAEHASRSLFGNSADLLGESRDRDRFEGYVHKQFTLADQNGETIALTPVGNELEGEFLWIYAEAPIPEGLTAVTLSHQALRDVWPEQSNLVNVEREGRIHSATFGRGSGEITLKLSS
jgi:hypothetical protein